MPQPAHPAKSQVIGHVSSSEAGQGPVQRGWAVVAQDNRRRRRRRDGARGSPLYEQDRKGEAEQWWQTRQPPGTRAMFKLGSLLDQQGKKREAKAVAAQSGSAGQQPWRRPTYEHHGPGGASGPGAYASWKWNWGNWKWDRNEETITRHPAPPDP
jgi:hypothetical protein